MHKFSSKERKEVPKATRVEIAPTNPYTSVGLAPCLGPDTTGSRSPFARRDTEAPSLDSDTARFGLAIPAAPILTGLSCWGKELGLCPGAMFLTNWPATTTSCFASSSCRFRVRVLEIRIGICICRVTRVRTKSWGQLFKANTQFISSEHNKRNSRPERGVQYSGRCPQSVERSFEVLTTSNRNGDYWTQDAVEQPRHRAFAARPRQDVEQARNCCCLRTNGRYRSKANDPNLGAGKIQQQNFEQDARALSLSLSTRVWCTRVHSDPCPRPVGRGHRSKITEGPLLRSFSCVKQSWDFFNF